MGDRLVDRSLNPWDLMLPPGIHRQNGVGLEDNVLITAAELIARLLQEEILTYWVTEVFCVDYF